MTGLPPLPDMCRPSWAAWRARLVGALAPFCAEPAIRPRLVLCVVGGYTDCHTIAFWAEMAGMGALMYPREHPRGVWVRSVASPVCAQEVAP